MPMTVPFQPGCTIATQPKTNHHKSHYFDLKSGIRTANDTALATRDFRPTNTNPDLSIARTSPEFDATQTNASLVTNQRRLPSWVAYDRKCLRFFGYFTEAVFSSACEDHRVRKVVLYYYLEDDTIHVAEPKAENSGIPQGVLIKRHRIPKADGSYVSLNDLQISTEIVLYCRAFRIVDCDEFTREFYEQNGRPLGPPELYPDDAFTRKNAPQPTNHRKIMYPMKNHMEASLGKMMGIKKEVTQRFLMNDRKVLRFFALWSDNNIGGEQRSYILHYFLSDDTVQVLDVMTPNSGREAFPVFLQRAKLPKDFKTCAPDVSRIGWTSDSSVQYVTETDFQIGSNINVYGRDMFICGCDTFTKNFYMANYGMTEADFPFLLLDDPEEETPEMIPPPYNGFGTEEDSLGSFLYLSPKVPKIDFKKLMQNDGLRLAFSARMVDPLPEDANRRFNITFHMNNDTLSIFERFQRNSGFVGGKFLERCRLENPATKCFFKCHDFAVGNVLEINKKKFELLEADRWTLNFIANNEALFKIADDGGNDGSVAM